MRVLLGMILGVALTLGVAYVHDSRSTSANATTPITVQDNMVNWEVVSRNWNSVRLKMHDAWMNLSNKMSG